jgi:tetratricopeptide (TPR) repeat protein
MRRLLILALIGCLVAPLEADYRDSFRRAVQARNRGRWVEVIKYLREAIAEQPQDTGERVNISGMDFVPYLPQFFLGMALFNVGDCVGALEAWQKSETQGAVKRANEYTTLQGMRKKCEARLAAVGTTPPATRPPGAPPAATPTPAAPEKPAGPDPAALNAATQAATAAINRAEDASKSVDQLSNDALLVKIWRTDAALGPDDDRARATLGRARAELDAGRKESNLQRLQEAASIAGTAQQQFDGVRQNAQTRRDQLQKQTVTLTPLRPTTPAPPPPANTPTPTAPVTPPVKPPAPPETPPVAAKPFAPPPALSAAARLLFSGRYQEAAASLGKLRYDGGPAAAQSAILRAAAQYSLYLVGGERDAAILDQARAAVLECRKLAPALQPDPQAFSPRFVEFYARTR